ncbi:LysR family transcriptional regulator [Chromobacterium violaceum]|uniref:LysR family transcriptional regulator n=1 Tax=Chromobacterium violaceum TaxID=536 RepID=UPI001C8B476E|nr:LysR family transcriptional regulator [Chromobacterium violaceum]MBX9268984.1 LysR family transcriptional regulator [Chromobacterium violaceum]
MNFNDQRVEYFFEATRLGGIRAAADHLDVSPSAISRQISQLEDELGAVLFERHRRSMIPTLEGNIVLEYYKRHKTEQETVITRLQEVKGIHRGHVGIVTGGGVIDDLLEATKIFSKQYPNITYNIDIHGTNDIVSAIVTDKAHIGIVFYSMPNPQLRVHRTSVQPLYAIAARGHPLANEKQPISFTRLVQEKIIMPDISFGVRQILRDAEKKERCEITPYIQTNSFAVMVEFAIAGEGVTIQPKFSVRKEIENGSLVAIPIQQQNLEQAELHLITHQGRQLGIGPARLLEILANNMPAFESK